MPYKDPEIAKEQKRKYYQLNKERMNAQATKWAQANREKKRKHSLNYTTKSKLAMLNYLSNSCMSCGYNHYYGALEFHHVNPEDKALKLSETHSFTQAVKEELDKCVVLCANCHREVHAGLRECPPLKKK